MARTPGRPQGTRPRPVRTAEQAMLEENRTIAAREFDPGMIVATIPAYRGARFARHPNQGMVLRRSETDIRLPWLVPVRYYLEDTNQVRTVGIFPEHLTIVEGNTSAFGGTVTGRMSARIPNVSQPPRQGRPDNGLLLYRTETDFQRNVEPSQVLDRFRTALEALANSRRSRGLAVPRHNMTTQQLSAWIDAVFDPDLQRAMINGIEQRYPSPDRRTASINTVVQGSFSADAMQALEQALANMGEEVAQREGRTRRITRSKAPALKGTRGKGRAVK